MPSNMMTTQTMSDSNYIELLIAARKKLLIEDAMAKGTMYVDYDAAVQSLWDETVGRTPNQLWVGTPIIEENKNPFVG